MSNALKFLLLAAACALVVLLITKGVDVARKGQQDTDGNLGQYSEVAGEYEDVKLKGYDSTTVLGKEVKRLIEEYNDDPYLSIVVKTKKGESRAYINSCAVSGLSVTVNSGIDFSALPNLKTDSNYINDSGEFLSKVYYDVNDVVACVWFEQQ